MTVEDDDLVKELCGPPAKLSLAGARRVAAWLAGQRGAIERQVRADVAALGPLTGARASYAQVAYRLARALDLDDGEGATGLAGAARELRAALDQVWKGERVGRPSDAQVDGLGSPVGG